MRPSTDLPAAASVAVDQAAAVADEHQPQPLTTQPRPQRDKPADVTVGLLPAPVVVGLSGFVGTHKEAVAQLLADEHDFHRRDLIAIARDVAAATVDGWVGQRTPDAPAILWDVSQQLKRAFGRDLLIKHALRWPLPPRLVVVGVRLETEASAIRATGGKVVRLVRDDTTAADPRERRLCEPDLQVDSSDIAAAAWQVAAFAHRQTWQEQS